MTWILNRGIYLTTLLLLAVMVGIPVRAQNAVEDMKKISETLSAAHTRIDVAYDMYAQHSGDVKIQSVRAKYYIWEKLLAYSMDDVDVFNNEKFLLTVDHETKNMVLNKATPENDKKLAKELMKFNIDSLLFKFAEITLLSEKDSLRTWRVQYKRPMSGIGFMDITLSLADYRLSKIMLYYEASFRQIFDQAPEAAQLSDKPRLEITYHKYTELKKEEKDELFYASRVLTMVKKGEAILKDPYKTYHLANYYNYKLK